VLIVFHIVRYQLFALLEPGGDHTLYEVYQAVRMGLVLELEIETVMHLLNVHTLLGCIVLDDELLEKQESTLVINSLTNLDLGYPEMGCVGLFTIVALLVCYQKFYHKTLL
jgi:hypothetical protein